MEDFEERWQKAAKKNLVERLLASIHCLEMLAEAWRVFEGSRPYGMCRRVGKTIAGFQESLEVLRRKPKDKNHDDDQQHLL